VASRSCGVGGEKTNAVKEEKKNWKGRFPGGKHRRLGRLLRGDLAGKTVPDDTSRLRKDFQSTMGRGKKKRYRLEKKKQRFMQPAGYFCGK